MTSVELSSLPAEQSLNPHLATLNAVQLRPHVEVEIQVRIHWLGGVSAFALVEVNHIFHPFPTTSLDDPVMSIERFFCAHDPCIPLCCWTQRASALAFKTQQFWSPTLFGAVALPLFDQMPCTLIYGVVDGNNARDA